MLVSELERIERRFSRKPEIMNAIDFLRRQDILNLADGTFAIDGDRVFAVVQRYETVKTDTPQFEHHRKYIDVQFIASGLEIIGWAPVERMSVTEAYDANKDIAFGTVPPAEWTPLLLHPGQAAILWPEDAHAPRLPAGRSSRVMKVVIKIAV